jgi:hypothetical protein
MQNRTSIRLPRLSFPQTSQRRLSSLSKTESRAAMIESCELDDDRASRRAADGRTLRPDEATARLRPAETNGRRPRREQDADILG